MIFQNFINCIRFSACRKNLRNSLISLDLRLLFYAKLSNLSLDFQTPSDAEW
jgi:hypothetical protein